MVRRRDFVLGSAAALAGARAVSAQEKVTIRLGTPAVESYGSPFFAKENGFYDKAGLDVQITVFNGGGASLAALLGGSLDIALTNSGAMSNAHARGVPMYLFFPGGYYTSSQPTTALLVAKNSPLRTAKDLNGKTVALSTLRDLVQISCMKWMDDNGGDSSSVKWIEMPTVIMGQALTAGRVDAAIVVEPEITENRDTTRIFAKTYDSIAKTLMISGCVSTKDWLDKNLDTARRFVAVMKQTAEWANKNHSQFPPILSKYTKIAPELIAAEQHSVFGTYLDPRVIQPIIDTSAKYKILPATFNASELFYPPLAPKA
jgi:NitT/TauT family transport system substrate-binding protein